MGFWLRITPPPAPPASRTIARGADTRLGAGGVALNAIFGSVSPSWTVVQLTGAAHWTVSSTTLVPVPNQNGGLAGPYTFSCTDSSGQTGTLTINTRANTFTVANRTEQLAVRTLADGKTVELAKGSTDFGLATDASRIQWVRWRFTTGCTIKHEDPANPCPVGNWFVRLPKLLTFDAIQVTPAARTGSGSGVDQYAMLFQMSFPTVGTDEETDNSVTLNNCSVRGPAGNSSSGVCARYLSPSNAPLTISFTNGWTAENVAADVVYNGSATHALSVAHTGISTCRYFTTSTDDINDGSLLTCTYEDRRVMSPLYDPLTLAHPDTIQIAAGFNLHSMTVDRFFFAMADGNLTNCQVIFGNSPSLEGLVIKNAIAITRSVHACTIPGTDVSHITQIGNYTALTQWSGVFGPAGETPSQTADPRIVLPATVNASYIALKTMLFSGSSSGNSSAYTIPASVVRVGGGATGADVSAYLPNASWITSAALRTSALANDVPNYAGNDDIRWHGTSAQVYADVIAALTPAIGQVGAVASDGSRPLATFP